MSERIDDYARRFARLRTNRNRKVWSEVTAYQAPYKPILLLCVLDLFDSGEISSNLVEISDDLAELFGRYSERVMFFIRPLQGRGILGPDRRPLWPDTESLRWHRENVLRTQ